MSVAQPTMAAPTDPCVPAPTESESAGAALVHAVRAGDRRACFFLWSRYANLVERLVRRFLGPGPDHQDVCQEVFLRIFRRIDELRDPAALHGFVVSVALGVARNEVRRRRIRSIVGLVPEEALPGSADSPSAGEAREALRALYRLLGTLSAEDRSLFVARFIEKMELAEVAAAHAMSVSTTKRRLARVLARVNARVAANPVLREYVGGIGPGGSP
jgi:RNA polymerase sigma-70 factor (ECF subfamily)